MSVVDIGIVRVDGEDLVDDFVWHKVDDRQIMQTAGGRASEGGRWQRE